MEILDDLELKPIRPRILNIGKYTAVGSFAFGTLLVILFYLVPKLQDTLIGIGFFYLIIAFFFNLLLVCIIILSAINAEQNKSAYFKVIGFMLANLPIALLYFIIVSGGF